MSPKNLSTAVIIVTERTGFAFQQGEGFFLFANVFRPALGSSQPPIQWISGALSSGVKRSGHEDDYSPPSSAEVKNAWSYTSTRLYVFMAWYLIKRRTRLHSVVLG
jgi:hypothetical protein